MTQKRATYMAYGNDERCSEVRKFIEDTSQGTESIERPLYRGEIDYDQLLNDIFESDRVICWW